MIYIWPICASNSSESNLTKCVCFIYMWLTILLSSYYLVFTQNITEHLICGFRHYGDWEEKPYPCYMQCPQSRCYIHIHIPRPCWNMFHTYTSVDQNIRLYLKKDSKNDSIRESKRSLPTVTQHDMISYVSTCLSLKSCEHKVNLETNKRLFHKY